MSPAELLTLLVGTPSVSGEEGPLANLVQELVVSRGFEVQRQENNLWFTFGKKGGPRLLLNSHLDTVPPCAGWEGDPFTPVWNGARLRGLGANDAKGSVAAILLAAFQLSQRELAGEVVVALTAEEETGGRGLATILDEIMAHACVGMSRAAVTAEMTVRYKRPVETGARLTARGTVEESRGRILMTRGWLYDAEGAVVAEAQARFIAAPQAAR